MSNKGVLSCIWFFSPMHCSPPGSSAHVIFPGKYTGVGCHFLFQGIFATQGSHLCLLHLLHWQADSLSLAPPGKPAIQGEFSKFNERERDLNPTISEISIDCDIDFLISSPWELPIVHYRQEITSWNSWGNGNEGNTCFIPFLFMIHITSALLQWWSLGYTPKLLGNCPWELLTQT